VVGLGNPGPRHARTRHNVGFRVAERFAAAHAIDMGREDFGGRFGTGEVAGAGGPVRVAVLEPQGFMNRSGDAVAQAVAALPVEDPPRDLLVVLDDVDLPFGRLRLRKQGGAGGHRGLADVIERLARDDFPRLRFGIGRPGAGVDTRDHVLREFTPDEERSLPALLARAADAVALALTRGLDEAMNLYNPDPAPTANDG
jgi:PTH1 family peptidyl-tRNA hydrolase